MKANRQKKIAVFWTTLTFFLSILEAGASAVTVAVGFLSHTVDEKKIG